MSRAAAPPAQSGRLLGQVAGLLALGLPLVLNNIFGFGFHLTNTLMGGRYGGEHLPAIALGGNLWLPLFIFGMGTLMAVSPTTAQHWGAGRVTAIAATARQGVYLSFGVSAVISTLLLGAGALDVFAPLALPEATRAIAYDYLRAMALAAPGMFLFQSLRFVSEGLGIATPIVRVSALGLSIHAGLSLVLVFGLFGLPALGAVGCGWASVAAMWTMAGAMWWTVRRAAAYRQLALLRGLGRPDPALIGALLKLGLPIGLAVLMESGLFAGTAFMMGRLGADAIAAHQVVINYSALMFMVPLGLAAATTIRVGQAAGRADLAAVDATARAAALVVTAFMLCSAAVMLSVGRQITALYTDEGAVLAIAAGLLPVAAAFQLFDGLQVAAAGALRGLKDTRVPMLLTALAYWGVGVPGAAWLGFVIGLGAQGIWLGLCAGLVCSASLLWLRFVWTSRKGHVLRGP